MCAGALGALPLLTPVQNRLQHWGVAEPGCEPHGRGPVVVGNAHVCSPGQQCHGHIVAVILERNMQGSATWSPGSIALSLLAAIVVGSRLGSSTLRVIGQLRAGTRFERDKRTAAFMQP